MMKNDHIDGDLSRALSDVSIQADKLHCVSWIMSNMADPNERPAKAGITIIDVMHLLAEIVTAKANDIQRIADAAGAQLYERRVSP